MGAQLVLLLGLHRVEIKELRMCSSVSYSASAPEPIQVIGCILVALGLNAPPPCCLSLTATHTPHTYPVALQWETVSLMLP